MPERPAAAVAAAAARWIGERRGPWFAWVHIYDPHAPYAPPPPFDRHYAYNPYAGEVASVDRALGPLLESLRRRARPVLVILTADHGEALGGHGEATHGLFAYEDTLHVPLIVSATDAGRRTRPLSSALSARHIDIVPTVLDSLGAPADTRLPGRSLLDAVAGGRGAPVPSYFEALTASLNRGWAPLTGVLLGSEKYIRLPIPELYDLAADPHEMSNLLPRAADRAAALDRLLSHVEAQGGVSAIAGAPQTESDETRRRLASLGYVSGGQAAHPGRWTQADDPKQLIALDQAVQRGVEQYQQGAVEQARTTFEAVAQQRPGMATPYLHLAFSWWEGGDAARAIQTLRRAVGAGAGTTEVKAQLGIYLAEAGEPSEAVRLLKEATATDPGDLDAWNGQAIALAGAGQRSEAVGVLNRVIAEHPTSAEAIENLGTLMLGDGNLPAARDAFSRALSLDGARPVALNGLGVVELRDGRRDAAVSAWRRVVALDPRQYDALYNLGVALLNAGDSASARPYLEQFAAGAPPAIYSEDLQKVRAWLGAKR
jgi:Tfp pilus assembly protein PilF